LNCRSSATTIRTSGFLLSLCSPVLRKMICGSLSEVTRKSIHLKDVDGLTFRKALDLWCGKTDGRELKLSEVEEVASVADRFQIAEVLSALEESVLGQLSIGMCGEVLSWSGRVGLSRLEEAARRLAAKRFEELAETASFMGMKEEVLGSVLDDDGLAAISEEAVWEAVARWMTAEGGRLRGRGLVGKIRFPLMEEAYLRSLVVGMAPAEDAEWMQAVVAEALAARAALAGGGGFEPGLLGPKALDHRVGLGVRWEEGGRERRLEGHAHEVTAVVECDGRVCSGSLDGSIRVWARATGAHERTLRAAGADAVRALAAWGGRVVGAHGCALRVWCAATGACEQVLEGHSRAVAALAICGPRLLSGSWDGSVRVWALGAAAPWACERAVGGHAGAVQALAAWGGTALSGSADKSIRAWDAGSGAHVATLAGHAGEVCALAVRGDRLYSASEDGTIRVWALGGAWAALRAVEAHAPAEGQFPCCLAVSGARLVSGSMALDGPAGEVRVWGLAGLGLERALRQPAGQDVRALLAADGEVWAGVGRDVVAWGCTG
jgi:hypothetical protein